MEGNRWPMQQLPDLAMDAARCQQPASADSLSYLEPRARRVACPAWSPCTAGRCWGSTASNSEPPPAQQEKAGATLTHHSTAVASKERRVRPHLDTLIDSCGKQGKEDAAPP